MHHGAACVLEGLSQALPRFMSNCSVSGHIGKREDQQDALKELLKRKQEGKPIERPERPKPTNVVNLMDALRPPGDNSITFFADPAQYQYSSCEQLSVQRQTWTTKAQELKQLMNRAEPRGRRGRGQRACLPGRLRAGD